MILLPTQPAFALIHARTSNLVDRFTAPVHPWLLAAFPALAIAASNAGQVQGVYVLAAVAALCVACVITFGIARLLTPSIRHAALVTSLAVVIFYCYGPLHALIEHLWMAVSEHGHDVQAVRYGYYAAHALTLGCAAALWFGTRVIRRLSLQQSQAAGRFLNLIGVLLLAMALIGLLRNAAFAATSAAPTGEATQAAARQAQTSDPDIYYVVLDGYARADVLADYYGLDNRDFLSSLADRGFSVNTASHANYYWTFLSLASALNLDYVTAFLRRMDKKSRDPAEAFAAIRNSVTSRFLQDRGYRYVHLTSTWGATMVNPFADEEIRCSRSVFANEYFRTLAEASWLKYFHDRASTDLAACHETNFRNLADQGARAGPKFVLAHLILPHHPYLFNEKGEVIHSASLSNQFDYQARLWEDRKQYAAQLQFVNARLLQVIDSITATSAVPPIIVLQSDHGPQLIDGLAKAEQRHVRLANFAAYLLPGAPAGLLPADTAPVNQFRLIFNHYFGTTFPALPQRQYYSSFTHPFVLQDVTETLSAWQEKGKTQPVTATPQGKTHETSN